MLYIPKVIVTEGQWIEKGMTRFAQSGADGLVIEKMSAELGCSKSSFYWYFKNRNEFIARIVDRWRKLTTENVIRSSSAPDKMEDQITKLMTEMFSATRKGDFLFYLRKLAQGSPSYQMLLDQIEQDRMYYAKELFIMAGMGTDVAEQKSSILYHYYLGWYERHKNEQIGEEELCRHIEMLREQLLEI